MEFEILIQEEYKEPIITIKTNEITSQIQDIIECIKQKKQKVICGIKNEKINILQQDDIINIYAQEQNVYANTKDDTYKIKSRLYEIENMLDSQKFVRISKSEIINIRAVKNFDVSFAGTISICFINGNTTYVSRRFVSKIKNILGL